MIGRAFFQKWKEAILIAGVISLSLAGIRWLGGLQAWEWTALDLLFQWRPQEPDDERIVLVGITEKDIRNYPPYPLTDELLAKLLNKIKAQNPRVIALDLVRDISVEPGHAELVEVFLTTPNLIGVGQISGIPGDKFFTPIEFPPELKKRGQIADIGILKDKDNVVRRILLYPNTSGPPETIIQSLGLKLAFKYLEKEDVTVKPSDRERWLQVEETVFYPFDKNDGGYIRADDSGYQILLNWRGPAESFKHVSITKVLSDKIPPDFFSERLVIVGAYAPSLKDEFLSPYSKWQDDTPKPIYGIEIHANLASQIISVALDNRPIIKVMPDMLEYLLIGFWIGIGTFIVWKQAEQDSQKLLIFLGVEGILLTLLIIGIGGGAFLKVWWIPLVPNLLGLWAAIIFNLVYIVIKKNQAYIEKINNYNATLEQQVRERTEELQKTQKQMLAQEKLAYLGMLHAGIAHEIKNPLGFLNNLMDVSEAKLKKIQKENYLDEKVKKVIARQLQMLAIVKEQIVQVFKTIDYFINPKNESLFSGSDEVNDLASVQLNELLTKVSRLVSINKRATHKIIVNNETNYDPSLEPIYVEVSSLSRVLVNLLTNAYDAVFEKQQQQPEDYVPTITLTTKHLGDEVEITISDNGIGIAPELRPKIFEPFFTTKPAGQGTGLGLSLSRDLIRGKYNGDITVESQPGEYTKFTIVLPFPQVSSLEN